MKEFRLGRSGYWFDPTALEAIHCNNKGASHETHKEVEPSVDIYHASEEEVNRLEGTIFEPDKLVNNSQIKRLRRETRYRQKLGSNF